MAFFTEDFLNARRADLLRSVRRFQYQINGGSWKDGEINSKTVTGNAVVVFVSGRAPARRTPLPACGCTTTTTSWRDSRL